MAQPVCRVCQKEVASWTTSSVGKYSDRSSLGSYCDGHIGCLWSDTRRLSLHFGDRWLLHQIDRGFPYELEKIILRFGMPLVMHSNQGREFENGLMKSLCSLLGCTKTRTAHYHPESDGMFKRFNRTCLMMLSMFVNDRRDNWHELLPFVMHVYRTSVHELIDCSPFRLMMGKSALYHRMSPLLNFVLTGSRT